MESINNVLDSVEYTAPSASAPLETPTEPVKLAQLLAAISRVVKSHEKHREAIQAVLVDCCAVAYDVETHKKNVTPFTLLVSGIRGVDQKAIIGWIEANAPAIWRADETKNKRFVFNNSKELVFDRVAIEKDMWWDYARPAQEVSSTIDFREQLDAFIKRMEREVKAGAKTIVHPEVLNEAKALAGKLSQKAIA